MTKPQRELLEKLIPHCVFGYPWIHLTTPECRLVTSLEKRFEWVQWYVPIGSRDRHVRITARGISALNEAKGASS